MTQQAVSQQEDAEVPEGTVVDGLPEGLRAWADVVIRPAMVVVSTGGPAGGE